MNSNEILLLNKAKKINKKDNITMGTQTITEVKKEETDKDRYQYDNFILGTQTYTNTIDEITDSDKRPFVLGTQTFTKIKEETTDSDKDL